MMRRLLLLALMAVAGSSDGSGRRLRPRTRRDDRNHSGLRAIRGHSLGTSRHVGERPARHRASGTPPIYPWSFLLGRIRGQAGVIGHDQTISQPFIVALMTYFAEVKSGHTVLEIGTGSGYQAAILARLVRKVCTVEIIPPLAEAAAKLLRGLGHENLSVKAGDGYHGWPECGPFDAVIVTAALEHVPPPLIEQLKVGGRLVMPVGPARATQQLTVVEKIAAGQTKTRSVLLVRFVPFIRSPH